MQCEKRTKAGKSCLKKAKFLIADLNLCGTHSGKSKIINFIQTEKGLIIAEQEGRLK